MNQKIAMYESILEVITLTFSPVLYVPPMLPAAFSSVGDYLTELNLKERVTLFLYLLIGFVVVDISAVLILQPLNFIAQAIAFDILMWLKYG